MRLMWTSYGVPGMKAAPGMVARTYSREDLQGRLAQLSGDGAFAQEFFASYVQGHDMPDFARCSRGRPRGAQAQRRPGLARQHAAQLHHGGLRAGTVPFESPLYKAGVAEGDQIVSLAGVNVTSSQEVQDVLAKYQPGRAAPDSFRAAQRRGGGDRDEHRGRSTRGDRYRRKHRGVGDAGTAPGAAGVAGIEGKMKAMEKVLVTALAAATLMTVLAAGAWRPR